MKKTISFAEVLEAADKLTLDEKETVIDILKKRVVEQRRKELVREIQEAQQEFRQGKCKLASPDEIMKEILS
jgi:hypothetical protein